MGSGIYVALSGAVAQSSAFDVAANNIANAGTIGFQAERVRFSEALSRAQRDDARYSEVNSTVIDPSAGTMQTTGNPLDLALQGGGHFVVETPHGLRYTRAGNFRVNTGGTLVSSEGYPVRNRINNAHIVVPEGASGLHISTDGTVSAQMPEREDVTLGVIEVARVKPNDLIREGASLFALRKLTPVDPTATAAGANPATPTAAPIAGAAGANTAATAATTAAPAAPIEIAPQAVRADLGAGGTEVVSGALEGANFNAVRGVVDLVRVSRTFETLTRMIEAYKDIDDRAARSLAGK